MKKKSKEAKRKKVPMVVTTEHRGVFFGWGIPTKEKIIILTDAQMCVYWSAEIGGVLGLASCGPSKNCRVSPAVSKITLQGITAITEATDNAVKAWQSKPWC